MDKIGKSHKIFGSQYFNVVRFIFVARLERSSSNGNGDICLIRIFHLPYHIIKSYKLCFFAIKLGKKPFLLITINFQNSLEHQVFFTKKILI